MNIYVSTRVKEKLDQKHGGVTVSEIRECFANRNQNYCDDEREDHRTDPITRWFIAETNSGRLLKICFVPYPEKIAIKTAYTPNADEIRKFGEALK